MLISVTKCRCSKAFCHFTTDKTIDPDNKSAKTINTCSIVLDDLYKGQTADAILKQKGGFQFVLETGSYDFKRHTITFELQPIPGKPVSPIVLRRGSHKQGTVTEASKLEDEVDCGTRVWCSADFVKDAQGNLVEGEVRVLAKFDGRICGRMLVKVHRSADPCSLGDTEDKASTAQIKALGKSGMKITVTPSPPKQVTSAADYAKEVGNLAAGESLMSSVAMGSNEAFVAVSCKATLNTDTLYVEEDCCCLYATAVDINLSFRVVYFGFTRSPFDEIMDQIISWGRRSETREVILTTLSAHLPMCELRKKEPCNTWVLTDQQYQQITEDLCTQLVDDMADLVSPLKPVDGDGSEAQISDADLPYWGDAEQGTMVQSCATNDLPVKVLRVQVYLCTAVSDPAALAQRKLMLAEALRDASAIFMQCCVRLHPDDIDGSSLISLPQGNAAQRYAGVADSVTAPFRANLIVLDQQPTWSAEGAGEGECPVQVRSSVVYGKRVAIWMLSPRLIAHEIGHNAGLACRIGASASAPYHAGYDSRIHVMGNSNDDPPHDGHKANQGLGWTAMDCVNLRNFVSNIPPVFRA